MTPARPFLRSPRCLVPALSAALLALSACNATPAADPRPAGAIEHVVLVWLKNPGDADARQRIVDASYTFRQIPGVLAVRAGVPLPSDREAVDDSFDVGVVLTFRDAASLEAYEENPIHRKAVEATLVPLTVRQKVYDVKVE